MSIRATLVECGKHETEVEKSCSTESLQLGQLRRATLEKFRTAAGKRSLAVTGSHQPSWWFLKFGMNNLQKARRLLRLQKVVYACSRHLSMIQRQPLEATSNFHRRFLAACQVKSLRRGHCTFASVRRKAPPDGCAFIGAYGGFPTLPITCHTGQRKGRKKDDFK